MVGTATGAVVAVVLGAASKADCEDGGAFPNTLREMNPTMRATAAIDHLQ
jgi:hypothetical protein